MPSVKGIGYTNFSSRPMEKTTSMNKMVADHGNKTDKTIRDFHSGAKYMCSECAEDLSDRTKGKICKYLERL